ncbi:methylated-DNA--[protein]-cysteine S-methyltransferase [Methylomonas sp. EFPC3]|uniref:methylated-DNA--[protein]-cysteine S-methyltransferase n=1 Tax=unclassified Methylomonas TaxID=2608980 RepID=UPI002416FE1D|nr:methylated-DNA--[protein]-cysteine S-methyltransferase [Methylomonas sp. EFPC3]WFP50162.1 methylated-DNA--[protein]-cysteine S-methyltransferase [Methylomonas sp. EFPC3]
MTLHIVWQPTADAEPHTIGVPVFGVELLLTLRGSVIVDASWRMQALPAEGDLPDLALHVRQYLLDPDNTDLQLKLLTQGSEFSKKVWNALLAIPVGRTLTYAELAKCLDSAPRAVAAGCKRNPYAGIIPCHRVVASQGIGGFMGQIEGEFVQLKRQLLDYERRLRDSEA